MAVKFFTISCLTPLNLSSQWNVANNFTHGSQEWQLYLEEEVYIENGNLILRTQARDFPHGYITLCQFLLAIHIHLLVPSGHRQIENVPLHFWMGRYLEQGRIDIWKILRVNTIAQRASRRVARVLDGRR